MLCDSCICKRTLLEGFPLCLCLDTNHDQMTSTNSEIPFFFVTIYTKCTDMLFQHLQSVPTSLPKYVWKCIFQTWLCSRSKVNNIGKEISYSEFSVFNYYQLMAVTSYMGVSFQLSAVHGHQYVAVLFPRVLFLIFKVHLVCFSYWLTSQSWLWRSQLMCSLIQSNIWGYAMLCHSYALSSLDETVRKDFAVHVTVGLTEVGFFCKKTSSNWTSQH